MSSQTEFMPWGETKTSFFPGSQLYQPVQNTSSCTGVKNIGLFFSFSLLSHCHCFCLTLEGICKSQLQQSFVPAQAFYLHACRNQVLSNQRCLSPRMVSCVSIALRVDGYVRNGLNLRVINLCWICWNGGTNKGVVLLCGETGF